MPKPIQASWNFLRENERLRGILILQVKLSKEKGVSLDEITTILGVHYYNTKNYLAGKTPSITNYAILKLARYFGLALDVEVTTDAYDAWNPSNGISRPDLGSHEQTQIR